MPKEQSELDGCGGIFPPFEALYMEMLLWHTSTAMESIDSVGTWLKLVKADDEKALELKKPQLFGHLQNIVQHAGAVSRYFWPAKQGKDGVHERRAARLRAGFGLNDQSPLKQRSLRNDLEYFDENLDQYLAQNFVGEFIPEYVDYVEREREIPTHIFKAFYTRPMIFVLLGVKYEMAPLVNELLRLHQVLQKALSSGGRLPK